METIKKIVTNHYFPAAAVLTAVIIFWAVGMLGGLSLLHNNQPPLATLTWLLFVYGAAVLSPLAGLLAVGDLLRRWRRDRAAAAEATSAAAEETAGETVSEQTWTAAEPAAHVLPAAPAQPAAHPARVESPTQRAGVAPQVTPPVSQPGTSQPAPKKPATAKARQNSNKQAA